MSDATACQILEDANIDEVPITPQELQIWMVMKKVMKLQSPYPILRKISVLHV